MMTWVWRSCFPLDMKRSKRSILRNIDGVKRINCDIDIQVAKGKEGDLKEVSPILM